MSLMSLQAAGVDVRVQSPPSPGVAVVVRSSVTFDYLDNRRGSPLRSAGST